MLPGERIPIHTTDMRQTIALTFLPNHYEWVSRSPTTITRGTGVDHRAGAGTSPPPLPERFRVHRKGTSSDGVVDVCMERNIMLGPWVAEEEDVGAAVSAGVPVSVVLYVPLWIVNGSHLAVSCVVGAMPTKPVGERGSGGGGGSSGGGSAMVWCVYILCGF